MLALNESWSNETSIGSGHSGQEGIGETVDTERPCGIDQPSALLLAFRVYIHCFSVYYALLPSSLSFLLSFTLHPLLPSLFLSHTHPLSFSLSRFPSPYWVSSSHAVWPPSVFEKVVMIHVLDLHVIENELNIVKWSSLNIRVRWFNFTLLMHIASFAMYHFYRCIWAYIVYLCISAKFHRLRDASANAGNHIWTFITVNYRNFMHLTYRILQEFDIRRYHSSIAMFKSVSI